MEDEEIYSPDEKRAFHLVGEFLGWFSRLEAVVDKSIIDILELEDAVGTLLMVYLNFSSKCNLLQELALADVDLGAEERKEIQKTIGKLRKFADDRNIIAHSMFSPTATGVEFSSHGQKKLVASRSTTMDEDKFRTRREEIGRSWGDVASLAAKIKLKTKQKHIAELVIRARFANAILGAGSKPN